MKKHSLKYLTRNAFTMIELVFVIVVIGILAAVIIPNTRTNPLQEAAIQLISHLRYTQHLAIVNDTYDAGDANWYKKRWQLNFGTNVGSNSVPAYSIFSDTAGASTGDIQESELARNPENSLQRMTGGTTGANSLDYNHNSFVGMKKLNLGMSYGITSVGLSGGCSGGARISFDYLGRPMRGDQSSMTGPYSAGTQRLITQNCLITLSNGVDNVFVTVVPETGYACISDASFNCL